MMQGMSQRHIAIMLQGRGANSSCRALAGETSITCLHPMLAASSVQGLVPGVADKGMAVLDQSKRCCPPPIQDPCRINL